MEQFKCQRCGRCCTQLRETVDGVPGGLLLFPDEIHIFTGDAAKDVIPTIAYTAPGSDEMVYLYYGMVNTWCPLYGGGFGCSRYEHRPLVCARYPCGAYESAPNTDCPGVDGGVEYDMPRSYTIVQQLFAERSKFVSDSVPSGAILYIYNVDDHEWVMTGVKT